MSLSTITKKALQTTLQVFRILIVIGSSIGIILLLRYVGVLGFLCFTAGMTVMTALLLNKKSSFIINYLLKAMHGEINLMDVYKEGKNDKTKEEEWVEVRRER